MVRIADTLAATASSEQAEMLRDLAYRGHQVSRDAHQALAGQLTGRDLALLELAPGDPGHDAPTGWTWTSDRDLLAPPAGPDDQLAARLDIAAALATIAAALRPSAADHTLIDPVS